MVILTLIECQLLLVFRLRIICSNVFKVWKIDCHLTWTTLLANVQFSSLYAVSVGLKLPESKKKTCIQFQSVSRQSSRPERPEHFSSKFQSKRFSYGNFKCQPPVTFHYSAGTHGQIYHSRLLVYRYWIWQEQFIWQKKKKLSVFKK